MNECMAGCFTMVRMNCMGRGNEGLVDTKVKILLFGSFCVMIEYIHEDILEQWI